MRRPDRLVLLTPLLVLIAACGDRNLARDVVLTKLAPEPSTAPAGEPLPVGIEVRNAAGSPLAGVEIDLVVTRGGGSTASRQIESDANGQALFPWTIGVAPVANVLEASAGDASLRFETRATVAVPYQPEPFGDVNAYLESQGIGGSTEDLAFSPGGELVLGVPGGLVELDASADPSMPPLSGETLVNPLGIAYDRAGNLWVADSGAQALKRITPGGVVETVLTTDGSQPLDGPNYVAIDRNDRILLSDPCLGELILFDPATGTVVDVLPFDLVTEGGPNGLAFDRSGDTLYLATENTGLLCGHPFVPLVDPIAGLFSVEVREDGFGARDTIAANVALFGDGVAFDDEDNLYAIFDTQRDFMLEESAVWVLPAGERRLEKFIAVTGRVLANLAFGEDDFGETTLYIALLAVPPFTPPTARGVERFPVGIAGLPLLP